jgi:hypothetical protein
MPKRKTPAKSTSKKYSRPGVEAAVQFLSLPLSVSRWNKALGYYEDMLSQKGGDKLVELDKTRAALELICKDMCITKDQLLDVVIPWKFTKGKPRNALKPLLQGNSEKNVEECGKRALEVAMEANCICKCDTNLTDKQREKQNELIKDAIGEMCNLKGVGPATASAVLSIFYPNLFAFMDDEVIEALYDGKRGYTLKIYEIVNERCAGICSGLNSLNESKVWTRYDVGKVLWTLAALKAFGELETLNELLDKSTEEGSSKRRRSSH